MSNYPPDIYGKHTCTPLDEFGNVTTKKVYSRSGKTAYVIALCSICGRQIDVINSAKDLKDLKFIKKTKRFKNFGKVMNLNES